MHAYKTSLSAKFESLCIEYAKEKKTEDCEGKLSIDQENGGAVIRRERGGREKKKKNKNKILGCFPFLSIFPI